MKNHKILRNVFIFLILIVFSVSFFGSTFVYADNTGAKTNSVEKDARKNSFEKIVSENIANGKKEIIKGKTWEGTEKAVTNLLFDLCSDPENVDGFEVASEIVATAINAVASAYGLGGVAEAFTDFVLHLGENPMSEMDKLQEAITEQMDEVHDHLDEIQRDISELSDKVDESTKEILTALSYSLEASYAKDQITNFMSDRNGNFNYVQFKNYLYGSTEGAKNPYYYQQSYYNALVESIVNGSSDEIIKSNYDALYKSLESKALGNSPVTIYYDYLMYNPVSGVESIQHYYYDYLLSNEELLGDKNAEFEALQFALDLYNTALFADHCISVCNNFQIYELSKKYGSELNDNSRYYYNGEDEYVTLGQIKENINAIEAREKALLLQMVKDVSYIFNVDGSYTVKDTNADLWIFSNYDNETFGQVCKNQYIYLNRITDDWCEIFGFEPSNFTYAWSNNGTLIENNDGTFYVDGIYDNFKATAFYEDVELYSINFVVGNDNAFSGGSGTEDDPYIISRANQFDLINSVKDGLSKCYMLINDIDFSGKSFSPIGDEDCQFNGIFNGNGYSVKNLEISGNGDSSVGLFGYVGDDGVVENLTIRNSKFVIEKSQNLQKTYVGAIAGISDGIIYNCHIYETEVKASAYNDAILKNKNIYVYAGGIAGQIQNDAEISYCSFNNGVVSSSSFRDYESESDGANQNYSYSGGIAANLIDIALISNCAVDSKTEIEAFARSECYDNFSSRKPYICVRACGIAANKGADAEIADVYSEANITKCGYERKNTSGVGFSKTNNCSALSNKYVLCYKRQNTFPFIVLDTEYIDKIKVDKLSDIDFPNKESYDVSYTFDSPLNKDYGYCFDDQLYECGEDKFKTDNLIIKVNDTAVDYVIIGYYGFDAINHSTENVLNEIVTIILSTIVNGEDVLLQVEIPVVVKENKPTELVVDTLPKKLEYKQSDIFYPMGGKFLLYYQDGTSRDVTADVDFSYDMERLGVQTVSVSYDGFVAEYEITIECPHNWSGSVIAPTCTHIGYTLYTCSKCGSSYTTDYVDKTEHSVARKDERVATCADFGYTGDLYCTVCGKIIEKGEETEKEPHDFYDDGELFHKCSKCGYTEEHQFVLIENETWIIYSCIDCDYSYSESNSREKIENLPRVVISDGYALTGKNLVVLYVQIVNNPGITGASFNIVYDSSLRFVYADNCEVLRNSIISINESSEKSTIGITMAKASADCNDGNLMKLVFETPYDSELMDEYEVLITYSASSKKFSDKNSEPIDIITIDGKITVVEHLPGDVNNDKSVDILDAVLIARYLSKIEDLRFNKNYADLNLDGEVTITDLTRLLQYLVGGHDAQVCSNVYKIVLNTNDGSTELLTKIVKFYNEDGTIGTYGDLPVIQRDGYRFDGWYTSFIGNDGKIESDSKIQYNSDQYKQTLYAHYTLNEIIFDGNGATGGSMDPLYYVDGKPIADLTNTYLKESLIYFDGKGIVLDDSKPFTHTFLGWALEKDGDVVYHSTDTIDLQKGEVGKLTLYAVWSVETLSPYQMNKLGYNFEYWMDNEGKLLWDGTSDYSVTGSLTMYAKWKLINFIIVYDGNGATSGSTTDPDGIKRSIENPGTLAPNNYQRLCYTFTGWNTKKDGTGTSYRSPDGKSEIQMTYIEPDEDGIVYLYAQWSGPEHTEVIDAGIEPTCTTDGITEGKHCSTCNLVIVEQEVISKLGHNYENRICKNCGAPQPSDGLSFSLNSDNASYSVIGIGSCTDKDVVIPATYNEMPVTSIGYQPFLGCSSLTSIVIPNGVTSIGGSAFVGCSSLRSITIPDSITSIDGGPFDGCSSLESVYITNIASWCNISFGDYYSNPLYYAHNLYLNGTLVTDLIIPDSVTSISNYAFYNCSGLTSVTIPDSVTTIGSSAFLDCGNLSTLIIGKNVASIGNGAFMYCGGNILPWEGVQKEVLYKGTETEWNAISIGSNNDYITYSDTRYYYSETEPTGTGNYWHYDTDGKTPIIW